MCPLKIMINQFVVNIGRNIAGFAAIGFRRVETLRYITAQLSSGVLSR